MKETLPLEGWRKLLVAVLSIVAVVLVAIFARDALTEVSLTVGVLSGAYSLGNAAEWSARGKASLAPPFWQQPPAAASAKATPPAPPEV